LGGIIDPTQGGTPVLAAEAGRAEAFVPLGAGKKIPVSFNFKEFSQAMKLKDIEFGVETKDTIEKTLNRYLGDFKSYGGAMESLKDLSSAFSNMNESLGTIIDILDTSKNIQNNLLTASHNG
jgi:hypothetical protein